MISMKFGLGRARLALLAEADRLETLAGDMRVIANGDGPTSTDLADAPLLDRWSILERPVLSLVGIGAGHPRLPDGPIYTSDVWVLSEEQRWARTLSRFYRLGAQATDEDIGHAD
jgi:hypothetical protein